MLDNLPSCGKRPGDLLCRVDPEDGQRVLRGIPERMILSGRDIGAIERQERGHHAVDFDLSPALEHCDLFITVVTVEGRSGAGRIDTDPSRNRYACV
jgi:hypothetical protein